MAIRATLKLFVAVLLVLFTALRSQAQFISNYSFAQSTGTYGSISGSSLGSGASLADQTYSVGLPFSFNFDGVSYSNIYVAVNGFITFGTTNPGSGYWLIPQSSHSLRTVSGFDCNLAGRSTNSEVSYGVSGIAPNREFVIQWTEMGYLSSTALNTSFQIRLRESTNQINLVYGSVSLTGTNSQVSVYAGLRGTSNFQYNTRSSSFGNWASTSASTSSSDNILYQSSGSGPSPGLTFTYTPVMCSTPTTSVSNLTLTPTATSLSGTFGPSIPAADNYLVIRTPGTTPLSTLPVNGIAYSIGNTIGNGIVVHNSSGTSFNSSSLSPGDIFTFTVFPYNNSGCINGAQYRTTAAASLTGETIRPKAYTWQPTSGGADYTVASNWSPVRVFTHPNDTLVFSRGGGSTVTNVPTSIAVKQLWVTNNTVVTFGSLTNSNITIGDSVGVAAGSTLKLGLAKFDFATGTPVRKGQIDGELEIAGSTEFRVTNALVVVNGKVTLSASASLPSVRGWRFNAGSRYIHARDGGNIPFGTFAAGSLVRITGTQTGSPATDYGQSFGDLEWDCPNQLSSVNLYGGIDTIRGNFKLINSGNFGLQLYGPAYTNMILMGDLIQQSGTLQLGPSAKLQVQGTARLLGGAIDLNPLTTIGTSLVINGNLYQSSGHAITKSSTGMPYLRFTGTQHQHIILGGVVSPVAISYELKNAAGASLTGTFPVEGGATNLISLGRWDGTGSFSYNAITSRLDYALPSSQEATGIEWPATNSPANVTLNMSSVAPDNRIYMPGPRSIALTLNLTKGTLVLQNHNLTLETAANATLNTPNDSTGYIAADSTGYFIRQLPAWTSNPFASYSYTYPVGDVNGMHELSSINITYKSNGIARKVGVRVKDMPHPSDPTSTSSISRYWSIIDDGGAAPATYTLTVNYPVSDLSGSRNYRLSCWNGTAWERLPSVSGIMNPNGFNYGTTYTPVDVSSARFPLNGSDFTARAAVDQTYAWTGALSRDYQLPANWTPARTVPDPTDRLIFNSGNADTIINVTAPEYVAQINITNNTRVVFQSPNGVPGGQLFIASDGDATTDELNIDAGSALILNSATLPVRIKVGLTGVKPDNATARIAGALEITNITGVDNNINVADASCVVTSTGFLASGGTSNGATITSQNAGAPIALTIYGTYEHRYQTVAGPGLTANWMPGSNFNVVGYTTSTVFGPGSTEVYNLTYNCPNQTSTISTTGFYDLPKIRGTLKVISTGTGLLKIGERSTFSYTVNNFEQSGGRIDFAPQISGTSTQVMNISGTFNQSGGTMVSSANGTAAPVLNFNGTSGVQDVSFFNAAPAGRITYQISNPAGINLYGTGNLSSAGFAVNAGGAVRISAPVSKPVNTTLALQYDAGARLQYDAPGSYSADSICFPVLNGPANVTIATGPGGVLHLPFSRTIPGILQMTSGNIDLDTGSLILGTSASNPGTLTYTGGLVQLGSGRFTRWFGVAGQPLAPGTGVGFFPAGTRTGNDRTAAMYFSTASAITTGGTVSLSVKDTAGFATGLSVADGSYTITNRTRGGWEFATGNGFGISGATLGMRLGMNGMFGIDSTGAHLRMMYANSVAGTHEDAIGRPTFLARRSGLSLADLNAGTFFIGSARPLLPLHISVQSGSWNAAATWNTGTVPGATDSVFITAGTSVNMTAAATAKFVQVNAGATLANSGNALQVSNAITNLGTITMSGGSIDLGPAGGGRAPFTNTGTLNISGGTLTVNGSIVFNGPLNQSAGSIIVDGNDSTVAGSVSGVDMVAINSSAMNLSGGSFMIRDPYQLGSGSFQTMRFGNSAGGTTSPAYNFIFGDGVSLVMGSNYTTFIPNVPNFGFRFGNIVVNGSAVPSGLGGRMVQLTGSGPFAVAGSLSLMNANARMHLNGANMHLSGNISVDAGAFLFTSGTVSFSNYNMGVVSAVSVPQTVSGAGSIRHNEGSNDGFQDIVVNNASTSGVSFNIGDFSYYGTLTFVKGNLNTGSGTITENYPVSANQSRNAGPNTGWVVGRYGKRAGTYVNGLMPVGDQNSYAPVVLNGVMSGQSYLRVRTSAGDHPAVASSGLNALKSVNRTWTVDTIGQPSFGGQPFDMEFRWQPSDEDASVKHSDLIVSSYRNNTWTAHARSSGPVQFPDAADLIPATIAGVFQVGENTAGPVLKQHPADQQLCAGGTASFTVDAVNASAYQWQVNSGTSWTSISNSSIYSGAQTMSLLVTAPTAVMNGYQYRCRVYGTADSVTSTAAALQITGNVAPTVSISLAPGNNVCAGTPLTFTATTTNGGTAPVYQWTRNGQPIGTNSPTMSSSSLINGETISCTVVSNYACAQPATANSNNIVMVINPTTPPTVNIAVAPDSAVCNGATVTFSATPSNGGTAPAYQWKKNGVNAGTNSASYSGVFADNDIITCELTSNAPCAPAVVGISKPVRMRVGPPVTPAVSIASNAGNVICSGTQVVFTATPLHGGTPTYEWRVNSNVVGTGTSYTSSALMNGDVVSCKMTSSLACVTASVANSNAITMNVGSSQVPQVSIASSTGTAACAGASVTFTATPQAGGVSPVCNWYKNLAVVGTGTTYTTTTLANNDVIVCVMASSLSCATKASDTSAAITMTVNPLVTPSVSIAANPGTTICPGSTVVFTATPVNGGTTPGYQWKKNGLSVGANSASYSTTSIVTGDVVTCELSSNAGCASPAAVTSNSLSMSVSAYTAPAITVSAGSTTVCPGTAVSFTAAAANTGTATGYLWKKNGVSTGVTTTTYTLSSPANNDTVTCELTTTTTCGGTTTTASNRVIITVTPATATAVAISVSPSKTICAGTAASFTAVPTGGGTTPAYQWMVNGVNVGTNSPTFNSTTLGNGDIVACVMSSNAACPAPAQSISNADTMIVNPVVTPAITISSSAGTTVCAGASVTFAASISAGGSAPAYQWKKNGVAIGTASTYTTSTLASGDIITCELTSSAPCATSATATSTAITMTVNPVLMPTVLISPATPFSICAGRQATFNAAAVNGGTAPRFQWKVNGSNTGSNSSVYTTAGLSNGDIVSCELTSSEGCASPLTAASNATTVAVLPAVVASVAVTVTPGTTAPAGQPVSFRALPANGGATPKYQWTLNGAGAGTDSDVFTTSSLADGDVVNVRMTSSDSCASPLVAFGTEITMRITQGVGVAARILSAIAIYPNPSQGAFRIQGTLSRKLADRLDLDVQTVLGQTVYSERVAVSGTTVQHQVSLPQSLADGIYLVRVRMGEETMTVRMTLRR
jgi:hypothetical protein